MAQNRRGPKRWAAQRTSDANSFADERSKLPHQSRSDQARRAARAAAEAFFRPIAKEARSDFPNVDKTTGKDGEGTSEFPKLESDGSQ